MSGEHRHRPRWIVYPHQPQPSYLPEGYLAIPPYHAFHTYGEAWVFILSRWQNAYQKYDPNK